MSDDGYVELTGDALPYHLRSNAPPLAECDRCHRQTWALNMVGTVDQMPQPDGSLCGGTFVVPERCMCGEVHDPDTCETQIPGHQFPPEPKRKIDWGTLRGTRIEYDDPAREEL